MIILQKVIFMTMSPKTSRVVCPNFDTLPKLRHFRFMHFVDSSFTIVKKIFLFIQMCGYFDRCVVTSNSFYFHSKLHIFLSVGIIKITSNILFFVAFLMPILLKEI